MNSYLFDQKKIERKQDLTNPAEPNGSAGSAYGTPPVYNSSIFLEVENRLTYIHGANQAILSSIDRVSCFPSAMAGAIAFLPGEHQTGWDGWIRLLKRPKRSSPTIPTGLLPLVIQTVKEHGAQPIITDKRQRPGEGYLGIGLISLRPYQQEAVSAATKAGRGVLDMPPRAGKTRTMAEIQRQIGLPAIWITPTDRIAKQTVEALDALFGPGVAAQQSGAKLDAEASSRLVVCCTAATAVRLSQEFFDTRQVIIVDEFHHASAKTYGQIFKLCDHIYYRFGMTGTFFRSGEDDLAMLAHLSTVVYQITAKELVDLGHLVPTSVALVPITGRISCPRGSTYQTGHGKLGVQEHETRNQWAAYAAAACFERGKTVLVLVGTKRQGALIQREIELRIPPAPQGARFRSVEFVSTDTPRPVLAEILESFLAGREVKILLGTSLLGEGVDLPSADALVYARGEKAEVSLIQNAYRVGTASPGKTRAIIVDFADRHHSKLLAHSVERGRIYYEQKTFEVEVLSEGLDLGPWIDRKCI